MASKTNNPQAPKATAPNTKGASKKKAPAGSPASAQGAPEKRNVKRPRANIPSAAKEKRESFQRMRQEEQLHELHS